MGLTFTLGSTEFFEKDGRYFSRYIKDKSNVTEISFDHYNEMLQSRKSLFPAAWKSFELEETLFKISLNRFYKFSYEKDRWVRISYHDYFFALTCYVASSIIYRENLIPILISFENMYGGTKDGQCRESDSED